MPIRPNPPHLNAASITLTDDPDSASEVRFKLTSDIIGGAEVVTSGACSVDVYKTELSVTGTQAYTLADGGYVGQRKILECTVAASTPLGTLTINDAFSTQSTVHVFTAVGQLLELEWTATGWKVARKRRAGVQPVVIGTTVLTGYDMAAVYACSVTNTVDSTGTKGLPNGTVPGEQVIINCPTVSGSPVGSLDGVFTSIAGTAATHLQAIGAVTDNVVLMWDGASWATISNVGVTFA